MKQLLALTALFISMSASAAVIDLGSLDGRRDTNVETKLDFNISDINEVDQLINNFSNTYTFELKAPATYFWFYYEALAIDTIAMRTGSLVSSQTTLEKQISNGNWQAITTQPDIGTYSTRLIWDARDIRQRDGTLYPSDPNRIDTMGKYRLTVSAQAAEGQSLISNINLKAYWALNSNAPITAPVPEPETYALMGVGLLGLMAARRRKMK